jgi:RimJ/RimL family protein N-acetyltransferase
MIYGERVRLRSMERDDLPRAVQWLADPEARANIAAILPMSLEDEVAWFEAMKRRDKFLHVLAIDARDGEGWQHIGSAGFHEVTWRDRNAEFGIFIGDRNYWSKGYGTDAVKTLVSLGFGHYNLDKIFLRVFDFNTRAIRCYEKAGFVVEGRLRRHHYHEGRYHDELMMGLLREEWLAQGQR